MSTKVVLLVDDSKTVGAAIRSQLAGYSDIEFHFCHQARLAVERARELKPTVMLLDLVMPEVDGMAVLKQFPLTWTQKRMHHEDDEVVEFSKIELGPLWWVISQVTAGL